MNNQRRKDLAMQAKECNEIAGIIRQAAEQITAIMEEAVAKCEAARGKVPENLGELVGAIEDIRDEEQAAYDGMPEGLQRSERGEQSQEAINQIEEALNNLDDSNEPLKLDLSSLFEEKIAEFEGFADKLEEAAGNLEEAQA
jgi:chromosome segregation ATPase